MKAFKELSYNQGFYAVRMEELATRAGVSKRTIYLYFKSKEDLVDKALDSFISEFPNRIEFITNQSDLISALAQAMESLMKDGAFLMTAQSIRDLQVHYPVAWQKLEAYRHDQITSVLEIILARTEKEWVRELDPRIIREAIMAVDRRFANVEFAVEMGMSIHEVTLQFAKLVAYPYV